MATLRLDDVTQGLFEALRQRYFPPERNLIAAHLTLFHTLPEEDWVREAVAAACAETRSFPLEVTGLRSLGRGVAYTLASAELARLHRRLAEAFAEVLSAQDRQKFQPHVVVQNKASPEAARGALAELRAGFAAFSGIGVGVELWRYLGGPWGPGVGFAFAGGEPASPPIA